METKRGIMLAAIFAGGVILGASSYTFAGCGPQALGFEKSSRRPWLGVSLRDVTPELAKKKNLKTEEGAFVNEVTKKSPADSAGILEGDVIVEFNGRQIYDAEDVVRVVRKAEVGIKAKVIVMRGGEKKELNVTLRKYPRRRPFLSFMPPNVRHRVMIFKGGGTMGLSLMELNPQLGKYFEAPDGKGALVKSVKEGSAAEKAGFKAGDVILKIGDKNEEKIRDVHKQLFKYEEGDKANFEILRKGTRMTLTIQIEEDDEYGFAPYREYRDYEGLEDLDEFEFQFPDLDKNLSKLRLHLDGMKKQLERGKRQMEKQIRRTIEKATTIMDT